MEFLEAHEKLINSMLFKDWKKEHPESYLIYGFIMSDADWQIGYYNKNKLISPFVIGDEVGHAQDSEAFSKDGNVEELDLSKVKITQARAVELSEEIQQKYYKSHLPMKKIFIIQNIDLGQLWNVTYVTRTFNTLNIKIDAENGKILKHEIISIFQVK